MGVTISRDYWFSAAHQIEGHPKCGRMHGHNYKVVVALTASIGPNGMVIDFGDMDKRVNPVIDAFDHLYIISNNNKFHQNPLVPMLKELGHGIDVGIEFSTAECLAEFIANEVMKVFYHLPAAVDVSIWETPKSMAHCRVTPDNNEAVG